MDQVKDMAKQGADWVQDKASSILPSTGSSDDSKNQGVMSQVKDQAKDMLTGKKPSSTSSNYT